MRSAGACLIFAVCLAAPPAFAQPLPPATRPAQAQPPPDATQPSSTEPAVQPGPPLHGPVYSPLRFDEDYRYLDGVAGTYQPDVFDPIKYIRLGDDWRLTLGGEVKGRFEYERNRQLQLFPPNSDAFFLHRYHLHGSLRYQDFFRVYGELFTALEENVDLTRNLPIYEDRWDLFQAFVDVRPLGDHAPLTLRAGRQELLYGKQRLISPLIWSNLKRRFDGLKLLWHGNQWDVDAFWVRPIVPRPLLGFDKASDHNEENQDFLGIYATCKSIPRHTLETYFLTLLDHQPPLNASGRPIDSMQLYTIGGRFLGRTGPIDYEVESALQTGKWNGDSVGAWFLASDVGYNFDVAMSPRFWLGFDYASGDSDPFDRRQQTFNQLFPLGHAFLGYADLVGRQNIIDPRLGFSLKPHRDLTFRVEQHFFLLAERRDALYNVAGIATRRDRTGRSGRSVGHEIDLTMTWQMDVHTQFEIGYSLLTPAGFLDETGPDENVNFFYVQYQLTF